MSDIYCRQKPIYVLLPCKDNQRLDESEVEQILDISEDTFGRDVLHFVCPICKERHFSLRVG